MHLNKNGFFIRLNIVRLIKLGLFDKFGLKFPVVAIIMLIKCACLLETRNVNFVCVAIVTQLVSISRSQFAPSFSPFSIFILASDEAKIN